MKIYKPWKCDTPILPWVMFHQLQHSILTVCFNVVANSNGFNHNNYSVNAVSIATVVLQTQPIQDSMVRYTLIKRLESVTASHAGQHNHQNITCKYYKFC
jgi:hypothetical protein